MDRKRFREEVREHRRTKVAWDLRLMSERLCESHTRGGERQEVLKRILVGVLELMQPSMSKVKQRKQFKAIMEACAYVDYPELEFSESGDCDILSVHGSFDVGELAKRMTWGSVNVDVEMVKHGEKWEVVT